MGLVGLRLPGENAEIPSSGSRKLSHPYSSLTAALLGFFSPFPMSRTIRSDEICPHLSKHAFLPATDQHSGGSPAPEAPPPEPRPRSPAPGAPPSEAEFPPSGLKWPISPPHPQALTEHPRPEHPGGTRSQRQNELDRNPSFLKPQFSVCLQVFLYRRTICSLVT